MYAPGHATARRVRGPRSGLPSTHRYEDHPDDGWVPHAWGALMGLFGESRPFLDALSPLERETLLGSGAERRFGAEENLLVEGDRSSHVLLVLRGWSVVSMATERGASRLILGLRGPGEAVGEMAALDQRPRSATVTALAPVTAVVVPGGSFRRFLAGNPRASGLVMGQLAARLRSADGERRSLASLTVLQRLAARLLELTGGGPAGTGRGSGGRPTGVRAGVPQPMTGAPEQSGGSVVDLAQHDLAASVGATREAVAKALRLLREEGVVRTSTRRVEIVDTDVLRLLAAGAVSRPPRRGSPDAGPPLPPGV